MTKFVMDRPGAPWDYPTLGFSADADGAILDGTLFDPDLTIPPDAHWTVYGGGSAETSITRYGTPAAEYIGYVVPEPVEGFLLAYDPALNTYTPQDPADLIATPAWDTTLSASIDQQVTGRIYDNTGSTLTKVGVVVDHGGAGEFDELAAEGMVVVFDHESGRWCGAYAAYGDDTGPIRASIGIAWSNDGIAWEKGGQILDYNGTDEAGHTGPVLVWDPDTSLWNMFTIMLDGTGYEGGNKVIRRHTTPSLNTIVWTHHGTVMAAGGAGWRRDAVWHPNFVKSDGTWYCFLNAAGTYAGNDGEHIGYATASTLAGPWTFSANPVIAHDPAWTIDGDPFVTKIPGGWRMDFFRSGGTTGDLYALTTDAAFPTGWEIANGGAFILTGTPGTYDAVAAHKPNRVKIGGRLHHYYTAVSDNGTAHGDRKVALATDPPLTGGAGPIGLADLAARLRQIGVPVAEFFDSFDRPNDATALGTASSGPVWASDVGVMGIDSGVARAVTLVGNLAKSTIDTGIVPAEITVNLGELPTWGGWGLYVRCTDLSNYLEVGLLPTGNVKVDKNNAGAVSNILASTAMGFVAGDRMTILDDGTGLVFKRNGVEVGSVADVFNHGATKLGLWVYLAEDEPAFRDITART